MVKKRKRISDVRKEITILKKDYDNIKVEEPEICIVETHKRQEEIHKKQFHGNLQGKIDKLQNTLVDFKCEFTNKVETFENIFQTYADVSNKSIAINTYNELK